MKFKPGFDHEFQPKRQRWAGPVRSIGRLMIVVAVCSTALSVMAGTAKHKRNVRYFPARVQRRVQAPQINALVAQPRDPFVVVPAAEIDAKMVVAAPAGIDDAMVFHPYTREQQSVQGAPAPGSLLMPFYEGDPGQVPENVYPPQLLPQLPAPAPPR
jgi:hypothetical protein